MTVQSLAKGSPEGVAADAVSVSAPGTVPNELRKEVMSFFLEVVRLRDQVTVLTEDYPDMVAAVQFYADQIDDYDQAMGLEEEVGARLVFDLLLDIAHKIGDATGWEAQALNSGVACDPRAAWPATAWPIPSEA